MKKTKLRIFFAAKLIKNALSISSFCIVMRGKALDTENTIALIHVYNLFASDRYVRMISRVEVCCFGFGYFTALNSATGSCEFESDGPTISLKNTLLGHGSGKALLRTTLFDLTMVDMN